MTSDSTGPLLDGRDLQLSFGATTALRGATISVAAGEIVALMGPSGSGKSTLLHCLAGVLVPDAGAVRIGDLELSGVSERERSAFRLRSMGFVFQFGGLVPELTLAENVALPLQLNGVRSREADTRARSMLEHLGVLDAADRRAGAVAGGQAQRAAVARALVHRPIVVFADEPTGSLDTVSGEVVLDALVSLARDSGTSVLIVTHDNRVAAHSDRLISMRDGRVVSPALAGV